MSFFFHRWFKFLLGALVFLFFLITIRDVYAQPEGPPPPPYTSSAHGNSTTGVSGRISGYGTGNCAHCHEQHASVGGTATSPDEYLLFQDYQNGTYNAFCTTECHDGTAGRGDNIALQYTKTYTHPDTGIHTPGESTQSAFGVRHGYCIDCHNPHVAKKIDRTVGSNLVSDGPLLNVSGVTVGATGAWTDPSHTFISAGTGITYEYQLCFKCHSTWPSPLPPSGRNAPKEFNPANASFHPVELNLGDGSSGSSALDADQMLAPWKVGTLTDTQGTKTMYCSDCHGSETSSDPAGPHGSTNPKILKGRWPDNSSGVLWTLADADATKANSFDTECLCLNCHPVYPWQNEGHSYSSHLSAYCVRCHVGLPHGSANGRLIAYSSDSAPYNYGGNSSMVIKFTKASPPKTAYGDSNCDNESACTQGQNH